MIPLFSLELIVDFKFWVKKPCLVAMAWKIAQNCQKITKLAMECSPVDLEIDLIPLFSLKINHRIRNIGPKNDIL